MIGSAESQTNPDPNFETVADASGITLRRAGCPAARAAVHSFIDRQFMAHFGASVPDDSPQLYGVFDERGTLVAGFGLRTIKDGLFSQCYLDEDVAELVASHSRGRIAAADIVELSHLSVAGPRVFRALVPVLADLLWRMGFRGLVCTATSCLVRYFRRRRLAPVVLSEARAARLPADVVAGWGRYYDAGPLVVFGPLAPALVKTTPRGPVR